MGARQLPLLGSEEELSIENSVVIVNKERFIQMLAECLEAQDLATVKARIRTVREILQGHQTNHAYLLNIDTDGDTLSFRRDVLLAELEQILEARTLPRAHYYLQRLKAGSEQVRTNKVNDINLLRWKEYDEVLTDSLWIIKKRDSTGAHIGSYWGNFVPQIPRQMMLRYTRRGEWVLDPFVGSGTTLIECRRLGRNGLGVELNPEVADQARRLVAAEPNRFDVVSDVVVGDSTTVDFEALLQERGIERVQLLIMHPPYHDIIRFGDDPRDLSNAPSVDRFLEMFGQVVERTCPVLDEGRFLAVVIGDKYAQGEWIPLGFCAMSEILKRGYALKSIIVKNFEETRAKRQQQELWRYRALVGGFYVFKHEYILLFRKSGRKRCPGLGGERSSRFRQAQPKSKIEHHSGPRPPDSCS